MKKNCLKNCMQWFHTSFNQQIAHPIQSQFANFPFPGEIQAILDRTSLISQMIDNTQEENVNVAKLLTQFDSRDPNLSLVFKQVLLKYRRNRAGHTEELLGRTFHLAFSGTIKAELEALDDLVIQPCFQAIQSVSLPRLKKYLSLQAIEQLTGDLQPPPREYDEKFHILQAPTLFFKDLAYFRAKCEQREVPVAIAFLDIDDFKTFNLAHDEVIVDRNLLPRFMLCLEANVYHHGYAYRQGGDEYLVLLPASSQALAIAILDEIRLKLSQLDYPEIPKKTTVSIGLSIADPDCPLTDRELLGYANQAKKFAKNHGKNCIATYDSFPFVTKNLRVVSPVSK